MAYLMKTSTRFLGEQLDFERESYLEGFIFGNPLILASSEDAPENCHFAKFTLSHGV